MAEQRRLKTYVHVDGAVYGPGDDIPAEVAARIGDHAWEPVQVVEMPAEVSAATDAVATVAPTARRGGPRSADS